MIGYRSSPLYGILRDLVSYYVFDIAPPDSLDRPGVTVATGAGGCSASIPSSPTFATGSAVSTQARDGSTASETNQRHGTGVNDGESCNESR